MKLSITPKVLILEQSVGEIVHIFLNIFFAAYFYKISDDNVLYLSLYNIVGWITATVGALAVANIIKTKNKVTLYRFGTTIMLGFILLIVFMGAEITNFVVPLGILYGIATATTGFPLNMMEAENVSNMERSKYLGYQTASKQIVCLIVPVLLGSYITIQSYQAAAILVLIFTAIRLLLTFGIKNQNVRKEKLDLKGFVKFAKRDGTYKKLCGIAFLEGLNRNGVMKLVGSLLIIYNTANDFELGGWVSIFSLCSIVAMFLFGKFYCRNYKIRLLLLSLICSVGAFTSILFNVNLATIIAYNLCFYVFMEIISKIVNLDLFNYSNREPYKTKYNTEYFTIREIFLNAGRTLGYAILLVMVGLTKNTDNLGVIFVSILLSIIGVVLIASRVKVEPSTRSNK